MQQLLSNLCTNYIGIQYSKVIITLLEKPQSLESLVQISEETYVHLIEKLKYLIKLNVITFEKKQNKIIYSIDDKMIMFFQRIVKYHVYVEENCSKQQISILKYFLEVLTSNFDAYIQKQEIKKEQIPRIKQIFAGLVKQKYLYQDEKAFDLKICQIRPQDIVVQLKPEQSQNKDIVESKQKETKSKSKGKSKDKQIKEVKQTTKNKKKIQLQKSNIQIVASIQTKSSPIDQQGLINKIQKKQTYFYKIRDNLIAQRVKSKFNLNKSIKQITQTINQQKYENVLDFYNIPSQTTPKHNLLEQIQTQLLEEYIHFRYGQDSLLIYKTLIDNQYVTQKSLGKLTRLQLKELRAAINTLYVTGIIKSFELKIERANTMVFWIDPKLTRKEYIEFLAKNCLNLNLMIQRFGEESQKEMNRGGKIEIYQQKLLRLQSSLLEIDDCLILYNH